MKTLIRNAHVLTFDAQDREYPRADILIDGDRIAAIGPGPLPGADGARSSRPPASSRCRD